MTPPHPRRRCPWSSTSRRKAKKPPRHLADLTSAERKAAVEEAGLPGFRAKQVSHHYFTRLVHRPDDMTDLPADLREPLVEALLPTLITPVHEMQTDSGTTRKTLWRLHDGALVESVLMRYPGRVTMCVSSQAGCGMACPFCATGQGGLQRNMSTARDHRAGRGGCAVAGCWRGARGAGPRVQRRVHGHG